MVLIIINNLITFDHSRFPEVLDLSNYKTDKYNLTTSEFNEQLTTYHLGAILMHVGKSAYSGHYMAQIKNFQSNEWFSFNDEVIHKIKKKQQLGCTEDEIEKQKTKSTENGNSNESNSENPSQSTPSRSNETLKSIKSFSTSNAYLLVYYRKDLITSKNFLNNEEDKETMLVDLKPSKTNEIVNNDNQALEKWYEDLKTLKVDERELQNTERSLIRSIYDSLWCNSEVKHRYFLNTEFIRKLLTGQKASIKLTPEATAKYMCSHKHLNPFAINRFKLINKEGLDSILTNYSFNLNEIGAFDVENNHTTRCVQSVTNIFDYLKLKDKLKDDSKQIRSLLKINDNDFLNHKENGQINGDRAGSVIVLDGEDEENLDDKSKSPSSLMNNVALDSKRMYWVGKESIKLWTSLALKKAETQLPPLKFNEIEVIDLTNASSSTNGHEFQNGDTNMQETNENSNDKTSQTATNENDPNDSAPITFLFNEDIVCSHGGLATTTNKRLVSQEAFKIFNSYFPNMRQFLSDEAECNECKVSKIITI